MKFLGKLLMIVLVPLFFSYCILWGLIHFKAKDFVVEKLELMLDKDVSIGNIDMLPLIGLKIKDLEIAGLVSFSNLKVKVDILKSIKHGLGLKYIVIDGLELEYEKSSSEGFAMPFEIIPVAVDSAGKLSAESVAVDEEVKDTSEQKAKKGFAVYLAKFILNNAKIAYRDTSNKNVKELQIPIDLLMAKYISFPVTSKSRFQLNAGVKISNILIDDCINLKGWLDWPKRNMNADLTVKGLPLDVVDVFLPSKYGAQNLGLDDAILELTANAAANDNDLVLTALLRMTDYHYTQQPQDSARALLTRSVIESLKKRTGTPEYEINLSTKLDKPEIDFEQIQASLLKDNGRITVDIGTTMVEQLTGKRTADLVEELDPKDRAAVGAAGAVLDSILGTKGEGENKGVFGGLVDAYTTVEQATSEDVSASQEQANITEQKNGESIPVVVEDVDVEDQLEDVAIEMGVSILKGLFD